MLGQKKSRIKRLTIWFVLNSVIFTLCYLNYRFQLKHRYLYKTLNVGLCFSRAAAMVINFNLILVWIPMCKYTLTRLAYVAGMSANRLKVKIRKMNNELSTDCQNQPHGKLTSVCRAEFSSSSATCPNDAGLAKRGSSQHLVSKIKRMLQRVDWRIRYWFCVTRLNYINSFLIAVDHCTSLHTICATTITIASIIHTIAHLINVINFSKNFDPFLTTLNMADYKGQNPMHLLVSVPGITGCFMIIILLLMSLSSIDIIRNQSFDLFQVFHRLSVVFVFLLILHPSSHVLKEQANVDRFHPDICPPANLTTAGQLHGVVSQEERTTGGNSSLAQFAGSPLNSAQRLQSKARAGFSGARNRAPPNGEQLHPMPDTISRHSTRSPHSLADLLWASSANSATSTTSAIEDNRTARDEKKLEDKPPLEGQTNRAAVGGPKDGVSDRTWPGNINGVANMDKTTARRQLNAEATRANQADQRQLNKTAEFDFKSYSGPQQANINDKTRLVEIKVDEIVGLQPAARYDETAHQVEPETAMKRFSADKDGETNSTLKRLTVEKDGLAVSPTSPSSSKLKPRVPGEAEALHKQQDTAYKNSSSFRLCSDERPLFVAQNTICWYVLSIGLSCYLFDLLLRRLRRSKSTIELLDFRSDREGNLIELILSSNHKRFAQWLPGQFVYLNCPQIATHEWHPFTISSMDNRTRQFTLHIKTGGDWTRKLRRKLELLTANATAAKPVPSKTTNDNSQARLAQLTNSDSQVSRKLYQGYATYNENKMFSSQNINGNADSCLTATMNSSSTTKSALASFGHHHARLHFSDLKDNLIDVHCHVASSDCYDARTGQLQVVCKSLNQIPMSIHQMHNEWSETIAGNQIQDSISRLNCNSTEQLASYIHSLDSTARSTVSNLGDNESSRDSERSDHEAASKKRRIDLFIDGPFHSPFERLLEQQVSVCIANGVGWTAFSSVFQRITNTLHENREGRDDDWWSKWHSYLSLSNKHHAKGFKTTIPNQSFVSTKRVALNSNVHLIIIVATIEQLKPFYNIASKYFEFILNQCQRDTSNSKHHELNPVREVKAFITRSNISDPDVREFCIGENLDTHNGDSLIVNGFFSIHFGKPDFEKYLRKFDEFYMENRKISVYCCGSYQVKRTVEEICQNLNKTLGTKCRTAPVYSYHEENF